MKNESTTRENFFSFAEQLVIIRRDKQLDTIQVFILVQWLHYYVLFEVLVNLFDEVYECNGSYLHII